MQQGMLFHAFFDEGAGSYVDQMSFPLRGEIDHAAFIRAWRHVQPPRGTAQLLCLEGFTATSPIGSPHC